jgi:hypothetical protein
MQISILALGFTDRSFATPRYDPGWALLSYVVWAVPHSLLGWRFAQNLTDHVHANQLWLITLPWMLIAIAIVLAMRRITRPRWVLAAVAFLHSVGLACMTIMANGQVTQRYLLPVEMLLFAAVVALLAPQVQLGVRWSAALTPLTVFAVFVLVLGALNYRWSNTHRAASPLWTEQIKRASASCESPDRREVVVRSGPQPFYSLVVVPCHVFRHPRWCQPPFCAEIGAAQPDPLALPRYDD